MTDLRKAACDESDQPANVDYADIPPGGGARVATYFMTNETDMPAGPKVLHVAVTERHVVITGIDDLHEPGRSLCGSRIAGTDEARVYQLLSEPLPGLPQERHAPANGIATIFLKEGRRYLSVTGRLDDRTGHLIRASEW